MPTAKDALLSPINLNWQAVQTVFLDMDGTLLDLHYDNHFWLEHLPQRLAEQRNTSPDAIRDYLLARYTEMEGTLDWYCVDYWQKHLGVDMVALKHETAHKIALRAHVEQFLSFLRAQQKRVVLLTNAHHKSVAVKFGYIALEQYFDRVITSHSLGLPKEHPDFWATLRAHEAFDPQHSLFIDDNLHVLRAAANYGVKYLYAIAQPDSQQPLKDTAEFTALHSYQQLLV